MKDGIHLTTVEALVIVHDLRELATMRMAIEDLEGAKDAALLSQRIFDRLDQR